MDIAAGQVAGPSGEERQRVPDLALEMKDRVDQIMTDRTETAVDIGALAAMMTVRPGQDGAAIQTAPGTRRLAPPAVLRLNRARRQTCGDRRPDAFDIPAHDALPKGARERAQRDFRASRKT